MSTPLKVRVVRTSESNSSCNHGVRYEYPVDSTDNIIYIRQPTSGTSTSPGRILPQLHSSNGHPLEHGRGSCVKRMCAGLCNFFRFKTMNVGYNEELRYPSPALCYSQGHFPFQTSSSTLEPNANPACSSLTKFTKWKCDETVHSEDADGEYIIYIPRMSRTQLQKKFVEPFRKSSCDHVIIHPLVSRQCVSCRSCDLVNFEEETWKALQGITTKVHAFCIPQERDRAQENSLRNQTRESSDPGLSRQSKKSRFHTSCHTSMEHVNVIEHGKDKEKDTKEELVRESKNASGDSGKHSSCPHTRGSLEKKDSNSSIEGLFTPKVFRVIKKVVMMFTKHCLDYNLDSKNTNFLYIPSISAKSSSCKKRKPPFQIQEKRISWDKILERHNRVARNRQMVLQETKDKFQTRFAVWMRRKLIGQMKKKLSKDDKSCVVSPPNMLESRYHHIHWLGSSGNLNNSVGRYFDKEENNVVALKIFGDKPFESMVENLDNKLMAMQEINSLKKMSHKNIVKLLGYFELHDKFHLILESCDHSLREEIEKHPSGLGTTTSKKMMKHVLHGLYFCHQQNCLHRDLSPENILVCKSGVVKIGDFDRSVFLSEAGIGTASPTPGSFVYNSPEILAGDKKYGLPSDVWSLGVIFCEMLTGRPPWNGKSAQSQLREIHNSVGPLLPKHASIANLKKDKKITEEKRNRRSTPVQNHAQLQQMFTTISSACQSFIMKCLDVNPLCRFTCGELLQHHFIKENKKR